MSRLSYAKDNLSISISESGLNRGEQNKDAEFILEKENPRDKVHNNKKPAQDMIKMVIDPVKSSKVVFYFLLDLIVAVNFMQYYFYNRFCNNFFTAGPQSNEVIWTIPDKPSSVEATELNININDSQGMMKKEHKDAEKVSKHQQRLTKKGNMSVKLGSQKRSLNPVLTGTQLVMEKTRKRLLLKSILVICTFLFCWTPYAFMTLWYQFYSTDTIHEYTQEFFYIFAVLSSCINPFLYGKFSKK